MRAYHTLIVLAALLAISGVAAAQNAPCPECDPDGPSNPENAYHSVDLGVIDENTTEVVGDTDVSHSHDGDDKGFWVWLSLCLGAFVQAIEDAIGIQTDLDANANVYADSDGVDVDASLTGAQHVCAVLGVQTGCELDFDDSAVGHVDGMTYEAVAGLEAATGADVFVPAVLPDTGDTDVDLCVKTDLIRC